MLNLYSCIQLFAFIGVVRSHSAVACTDLQSDEICLGFPRYYHFNILDTQLPSSSGSSKFYASRDREFQLQEGIAKICPELPLPEYTDEYPMATAHAGQTLTLQHPPRGHSSQPSSVVWVYMYPIPNMYPQNKQLNSSEFQLVAEYPFDNCTGVQQEISWANCTGTMRIPDDLTPGVYSFWWRWDLNGIKYSDCFEIDITTRQANQSNSSSNSNSNRNRIATSTSQICTCMETPMTFTKTSKSIQPTQHAHIHN